MASDNRFIEAAFEYRSAGFSPIPVDPASKRPLLPAGFLKKYSTALPTNEEIHLNFQQAKGIGIISPTDVINIDVDGDTWNLVADRLPEELAGETYVEKSPHGYHLLFKVPPGIFDKKLEISFQGDHRGLEVKPGTSGYLVTYPTPGYNRLSKSLKIAELSLEDARKLKRRFEVYRQYALLIDRFASIWSEGCRHNIAGPLAGSLRKAGLSREEALIIIDAICSLAGDREKPDRLRYVEDSYSKPETEIAGFSVLREILIAIVGPDQASGFMQLLPRREEEHAAIESIEKNLIEYVKNNFKLFHDQFREGYIRVNNQNLRIRSRQAREFLNHLAYSKFGKVLRTEQCNAVKDALNAAAIFEGEYVETFLRVAKEGEAFYYDLGDGYAVRILPGSWEIVESPIFFRSYQHSKPQVHPAREGDPFLLLKHFRLPGSLVSLSDEQVLLLVKTIADFIPGIPHPILAFTGPRGSSKSLSTCLLKSLVDPASTETLTMQDRPDELALQLCHHYLAAFDNVSSLRTWQSDMFCRAATGSAFSKRELYTNEDEVVLSFKHLIVLNGINNPASRPDLLDRLIMIQLEPIPLEERRLEAEVKARFREDLPSILGGIFNVIAKAMLILPSVRLKKLPRMADFTLWGYAVAEALGIGGNRFLQAYEANIKQLVSAAIEASPVATAILKFMENRGEWEGSANDLLAELKYLSKELKFGEDDLPKRGWSLTRKLKEVVIDLGDRGVKVSFLRTEKERRIRLEKIPIPRLVEEPVEPKPTGGLEEEKPETGEAEPKLEPVGDLWLCKSCIKQRGGEARDEDFTFIGVCMDCRLTLRLYRFKPKLDDHG
jgi:hypothetical protein